MLFLCSLKLLISSSLQSFSLIALSINLLRIGFGSVVASFNALSTVISLSFASSSSEISFLLMYCGFIAATCIAIFVIASLAASSVAPFAAMITPILPPPWI